MYKQKRLQRCNASQKTLLCASIAQTFIKNENNFPLVDHIDRNKRNNHVENLRWATSKMNIDNQEKVDKALKKYGVRRCDDPKAYYKVYGIYKRIGKK